MLLLEKNLVASLYNEYSAAMETYVLEEYLMIQESIHSILTNAGKRLQNSEVQFC